MKKIKGSLTKKIAFGDNFSRQAIQIEGGIPPCYLKKGAGKVRFSVVRKVLYTFLHYKKLIFVFFLYSLFCSGNLFAFEEIITVSAQSPQGVTLFLKKGEYIVEIAGCAITLFYPIDPNYQWLISVAVGTDVEGGQDEPNIGTVYFEPEPPVYTQAEAEHQAIEATKEKLSGTYLRFVLQENKKVRFWVSDFDYRDNSGMVKLKIHSIPGEF